jgi:nucleoid-associated protein YgaU
VTNDAKLGLVVGVALVIAAAVVFFRKESSPTPPPSPGATAPTIPVPNESARAPKARPSVLSAGERRHTVAPGETLAGVAQQYYGDPARADELYRANRDRLGTAGPLDPGTELIIPELPATRESAADAGS